MKYFVTHCTFDRRFTGNPFWHSSLLLSKWDETNPNSKIEVVRHEGFYGLPSTTRKSFLDKIKIHLGLDVDFSGNHGWWKPEELRFLDAGNGGLHGATFEITEEQFNQLNERCSRMKDEQKAAVNEHAPVVKSELANAGTPFALPTKWRIHENEGISPLIYAKEKQKDKPRLKPFDLKVGLGLWGPDLTQSHTCKSQALDMLRDILPPEHIERLGGSTHPTVPRLSGPQETIYFHSEGPLHQHQRSNGKTVNYRYHKDAETKLYWTLPPQELIPLPGSKIKEQLAVSPTYCEEAKKIIRRLQQIEWLFINANLPTNYAPYRERLLALIQEHYEYFATITTTHNTKEVKGFKGYLLSLFNEARNNKEDELLDKIAAGKELLNSLYTAMVDDWEIHDNSLITPITATDNSDEAVDVEALAAYLSTEDKQELCKILNRPYLQPTLDEFLDAHSCNR